VAIAPLAIEEFKRLKAAEIGNDRVKQAQRDVFC